MVRLELMGNASEATLDVNRVGKDVGVDPDTCTSLRATDEGKIHDFGYDSTKGMLHYT